MKNRIVGTRDQEGRLHLFVDGMELDPKPSQKVWNHSPDGFNAGYAGSGPAQSALAILLHVLKDERLAVNLHQTFKNAFLTREELQTKSFAIEIDVKEWAMIKALGY